jgi:hypothetical protein
MPAQALPVLLRPVIQESIPVWEYLTYAFLFPADIGLYTFALLRTPFVQYIGYLLHLSGVEVDMNHITLVIIGVHYFLHLLSAIQFQHIGWLLMLYCVVSFYLTTAVITLLLKLGYVLSVCGFLVFTCFWYEAYPRFLATFWRRRPRPSNTQLLQSLEFLVTNIDHLRRLLQDPESEEDEENEEEDEDSE